MYVVYTLFSLIFCIGDKSNCLLICVAHNINDAIEERDKIIDEYVKNGCKIDEVYRYETVLERDPEEWVIVDIKYVREV